MNYPCYGDGESMNITKWTKRESIDKLPFYVLPRYLLWPDLAE